MLPNSKDLQPFTFAGDPEPKTIFWFRHVTLVQRDAIIDAQDTVRRAEVLAGKSETDATVLAAVRRTYYANTFLNMGKINNTRELGDEITDPDQIREYMADIPANAAGTICIQMTGMGLGELEKKA